MVLLENQERQGLLEKREKTDRWVETAQWVPAGQRVAPDLLVLLGYKEVPDLREQKDFGVTLEDRANVVPRVTMDQWETQALPGCQDLRAHQDKIS